MNNFTNQEEKNDALMIELMKLKQMIREMNREPINPLRPIKVF